LNRRTTAAALAVSLALLVGILLAIRPRRPNVLLISIDTLRADHLSCYGYSRNTSPFLDQLARRGTLFESVRVPLPSTDASHASLLTSLHPLHHGVLTLAVKLPEGFETLGEAFRRKDYVTLGAVSVFHLGRPYRFDRGFDAFSDTWELRPPRDTAERRDASTTNRAVLELLDGSRREKPGRPFFLFVHYFDVHGVYAHANPAFAPTAKADKASPEAMIARYDAGVRYVDDYIRRLFEALEARGLMKNLIVGVTADHGEQLAEHGYSWGHADFYDDTVKVPLILVGPGVPASRVREPISTLDIGMFLLRTAGTAFRNPVDGEALRALSRPDPEAGGRSASATRALLVLGNTWYTRSLRLVAGERSYIRNLDYFYRYALVGPGGISSSRAAEGFVEIGASGSEGTASVFPVPRLSVDAAAVTAEIVPRPGCAVDVNVFVTPALGYFDPQPRFRSPGRLVFAAGRNDAAELRVSPGSCLDRVRMKIDPYAGSVIERPGSGSGTVLETEVFKKLVTLRKNAEGDELYDLRQDPGMARNLAGTPEFAAQAREDAARTERLFNVLTGGKRVFGAPPLPYSAEEVRKLRNLGYLN
jgi:arylsulfatase